MTDEKIPTIICVTPTEADSNLIGGFCMPAESCRPD